MPAQTWAEISSGVFGNPELDKKVRHLAPLMARFSEVVTPAGSFSVGKNSGDRVTVTVFGRITTLVTTPLNENTKVPLTAPPRYEVTGQIYRYAKGIVWTGTREDLDRLSVRDENVKALTDLAMRSMNKLIYDQLVTDRSFVYTPKTATTFDFNDDGTVTDASNSVWNWYHTITSVEQLELKNMPPADGDMYIMVCGPKIHADFLRDTAAGGFVDIAKYDPSRVGGVLAGEVGKAGRLRIVVDNSAVLVNTAANANGTAFILGYEALHEIPGPYPLHLRAQMNVGHDFGNQSGIAYQMLQGWKSKTNYTTHGEGSICHVTGT